MTSHALYSWHHMHYILHIIYCVWYHIQNLRDITQCLYLWHHTLYVYDVSMLYGIIHSVMITQPLCNFTLCQIHMHCIHDITCSIYDIYLLCVISHSLYVWVHTMTVSRKSHTLRLWLIYFIWHHTQCYDNTTIVYFIATMSDIAHKVFVSSHTTYQFYQTQCMYDITSTIYM